MTNLTNVLELLREEQRQAQEQVQKLQGAISVIEGLVGLSSRAGARRNALPKRRVSAAARKRMSQAQKARWASQRKPPQSTTSRNTSAGTPAKRTLSLAARRKIGAAQRARWAKVKAAEKKVA